MHDIFLALNHTRVLAELKPKWESVHSLLEYERQLRLDDYEQSKETRFTRSCAGYGLCHSTDHKELDPAENHRCHRLYTTIQRQDVHEYSQVFYEGLNWSLYLRVLALFGLVMFALGCSLRGCGKLSEVSNLFETTADRSQKD